MIYFQTIEKSTWGPVRFGLRPFLHKRYCHKKEGSQSPVRCWIDDDDDDDEREAALLKRTS